MSQFHPEVQALNNPDPMILVLAMDRRPTTMMRTLYRTVELKFT